jgi:hypothetical protein
VRGSNGPVSGELISGSAGGGAPVPREVTRITVGLAPKVAADLRRSVTRTQLSQTDVVNRAVTLFDFIDSELAGGADLILRKDGQDHVVKLL